MLGIVRVVLFHYSEAAKLYFHSEGQEGSGFVLAFSLEHCLAMERKQRQERARREARGCSCLPCSGE